MHNKVVYRLARGMRRAGAVVLRAGGKRLGYGKTPFTPHNLILSVIGASLLWVGWVGFNAGSELAAPGQSSGGVGL